MSLSLTEEECKTEREKVQTILTQLKTTFTDLENVLQSFQTDDEHYHYMFEEFTRHGQEFLDYFTDIKIEELYTR